ncbi:MAG: glycerophosphodiester phosphodiesterase [Candidatus Thiodiazotropha sp. (ex Monitilora ramsayi)]|nr:glycerophosphodiester phosphodiesterase [Candidatus Thiodiazotropha sp. (ex Monitilora ramsayi)]
MNTQPTGMWTAALLCLSLLSFNLNADPSEHHGHLQWTMEDLLESQSYPFAIGHRGYGANDGSDTSRPIENSIDAVRRAFLEGIQVVEVDVVQTLDGKAVALHDDYLDDFTCVNQLTFDELKTRLPSVAKLKQILHAARRFSRKRHSERPSGLVIVEIKTPSPLCDPDDSSQLSLTEAVVSDITKSRMTEQVLIESFSPEILGLVAERAPQLPRTLAISAFQLLTPEMIEAYTGLPVTLMEKSSPFGLQWVEAGTLFRAPLYGSANDYLFTLSASLSRAASIDKAVIQLLESQAPGTSSLLIAQLHQIGQRAMVYTVNDEAEWLLLATLGVDGIYTDDVPMGLALEGIGSTAP